MKIKMSRGELDLTTFSLLDVSSTTELQLLLSDDGVFNNICIKIWNFAQFLDNVYIFVSWIQANLGILPDFIAFHFSRVSL